MSRDDDGRIFVSAFITAISSARAFVSAFGKQPDKRCFITGNSCFQCTVYVIISVIDSIVEMPLQVAMLHASGTELSRKYGRDIFGGIGGIGVMREASVSKLL